MEMETDEIGKIMMEKIREDPSFIQADLIWPEILKRLRHMSEMYNGE